MSVFTTHLAFWHQQSLHIRKHYADTYPEYRFCWHRSISAPSHEDIVAFQDFLEDSLHALGDETLWLGSLHTSSGQEREIAGTLYCSDNWYRLPLARTAIQGQTNDIWGHHL